MTREQWQSYFDNLCFGPPFSGRDVALYNAASDSEQAAYVALLNTNGPPPPEK